MCHCTLISHQYRAVCMETVTGASHKKKYENKNFIRRSLISVSHSFAEVERFSKYCPQSLMHCFMCCIHLTTIISKNWVGWEHWNECVLYSLLHHLTQWQPRRASLNFKNTHNSHVAKSSEYGGWGKISVLLCSRYSMVLFELSFSLSTHKWSHSYHTVIFVRYWCLSRVYT